jgi:gamma-glutamyltranspeptidase/glutathione hydrolase
MPENQSQSGGPAGDANSEVYFEDTFPKETVDKLIGVYPDLMLTTSCLM